MNQDGYPAIGYQLCVAGESRELWWRVASPTNFHSCPISSSCCPALADSSLISLSSLRMFSMIVVVHMPALACRKGVGPRMFCITCDIATQQRRCSVGRGGSEGGRPADAHLEDLWLCCLDWEAGLVHVTHVAGSEDKCNAFFLQLRFRET